MNFLIYVERSAENLQFYMWHKGYIARFKEAKTSDIVLAPEWTAEMLEEAITRIQKDRAEKVRSEPKTVVAEIFKGTDFEKRPQVEVPPIPAIPESDTFGTPPKTPDDCKPSTTHEVVSSPVPYRDQANDAFASAGAKVPCKLH